MYQRSRRRRSVVMAAVALLSRMGLTAAGIGAVALVASPSAQAADGTFSCRSSVVRVEGVAIPLPTIEPFIANSPDTPCATRNSGLIPETTAGPVTLTVVQATTTAAQDSAAARATVASVAINAIPGTPITAQVLTSRAGVACDAGTPTLSGEAHIVRITIGTTVIEPVPKNTVVPIPSQLGTLVLNQETTSGTSITERAIDLRTPLLNVIVAESIANFEGTPCAPGGNDCGGPGQPACPCGGPGQPACPCGHPGEPACPCGGAGEPACPCGHEGEPACPCGHEGEPACPPCDDADDDSCPPCGGTGQPACPPCDDADDDSCPPCGGTGQPACPPCDDADDDSCPPCGGTGQPACPPCDDDDNCPANCDASGQSMSSDSDSDECPGDDDGDGDQCDSSSSSSTMSSSDSDSDDACDADHNGDGDGDECTTSSSGEAMASASASSDEHESDEGDDDGDECGQSSSDNAAARA